MHESTTCHGIRINIHDNTNGRAETVRIILLHEYIMCRTDEFNVYIPVTANAVTSHC